MLFCIDGRYIRDDFPGIGRYTYHLVDALARFSPEDEFLVLSDPSARNTRYDLASLERTPGVVLRRVDVPILSLPEQWVLPRALEQTSGRVHLFHSPYFIKPYFMSVPSVVTLFDLIPLLVPEDVPSRRGRLAFRVAVWLAARTAARVIAPSEATRRDLVSKLRVPSEKIAVVPLAADGRFKPQARDVVARVRDKYSLPAAYVLSVGINKPHKNLDLLVRAWSLVPQGLAPLVIAGAWDSRYQVSTGDADLGNVRFIHDVPEGDLPALYAGASLFVMPSLYEGFGLPGLEAMACGAPVLASNSSSLPEVVADAARLFYPRDEKALASLIAQVLEDAACRDRLRASGLARAAEFTWERTARETLQVYREAQSAR